jgi:hypothetical protein
MSRNSQFEHGANDPALVLFSPDAGGGLWDPEASALVEDLEEDLEVFVTCAGRGRGALGLNDAASAARFMGCGSLVVIAGDGVQLPMSELDAISERFGSPVIAVQAEWSSQALSEAYKRARLSVPRAA